MKRAAIVFHSVCGNTYLLAREYEHILRDLNVDTALYRVRDPNFEQFAPLFTASQEYAEALRAVPVLPSPAALLPFDALFFGSPTYFGNVSAAIKTCMDEFCAFWADASFEGKAFGAFACASTPQGGGDVCLLALNIFAQHMGMLPLSVPANIAGCAQPAYGILHCSGETALSRPDTKIKAAICDYLTRAVNR